MSIVKNGMKIPNQGVFRTEALNRRRTGLDNTMAKTKKATLEASRLNITPRIRFIAIMYVC